VVSQRKRERETEREKQREGRKEKGGKEEGKRQETIQEVLANKIPYFERRGKCIKMHTICAGYCNSKHS